MSSLTPSDGNRARNILTEGGRLSPSIGLASLSYFLCSLASSDSEKKHEEFSRLL